MHKDVEDLKNLIAAARQREQIKDCPSCGRPYKPTASWQKFCGVSCRNAYHNTQATLLKERKMVELERLKQDKEELIKEISALKKQIKELEGARNSDK